MSGWLKLHRSLESHWLYTEKRSFSKLEAWLDILIAVNYAEAKTIIKGKIYTVKRGESIMSLDTWGKRWNWDKSKVRRFFELLVVDKMIEVQSDNITTHLKVCNYASYQDERNADETQMKRKRNTDEIQTTPIEEEEERNNTKKTKKENILSEFDLNLKTEYPNVYKMSDKLTEEQYNKAIAKYSKQLVDSKLSNMDNYKKLKDYVSAYKTLIAWCDKEPKQQNLFNQPKEQFEKPFDPSEVMPAWKLELMLKQGKLNT